MTREDLCQFLNLPPDTPPAALLQARAARMAEVQAALGETGLPKPVKMKLLQEAAWLASAGDLVVQLEITVKIETYFGDIKAEQAKPGASRGVIRLCLGKLKPLILEVKDETARFDFEKRVVEIEERLVLDVKPQPARPSGASEPPCAVPASVPRRPSTPPVAAPPPVPRPEVVARLEAYFVEIDAEMAKPKISRAVVQRCMDGIGSLLGQIPDETARKGYEKRIAQLEDRLSRTRSPFDSQREGKGAGPAVPPAVPAVAGGPGQPRSPQPIPEAAAPPKAGEKLVRGTLLQLIPTRGQGTLRKAGTPIHLVARSCFLLGRRRTSVDFVTAFLPENAENRLKTDTISRTNTTFFVKDNQIWVHDGGLLADGKIKPSMNGSFIDGQAISAPVALDFAKERRLKLGQFGFELAGQHLAAIAPEGPLVAAAAAAAGPSTRPTQRAPQRPLGCLRFQSLTCREITVEAVWLLSEATFGSDARCAVRLERPGMPATAARVHFWQDAFWLEVPRGGKSVVVLDDRPLAAGEVVALRSAHALRLGDQSYELRIS